MTDKTDYKAALEIVEKHIAEIKRVNGAISAPVWIDADVAKTVQEALEIADRMQSGEVSEGMIRAAKDAQFYKGIEREDLCENFKAMTAQLLKEVRDE